MRGSDAKALPRSVLKLRKTQSTPDSSNNHIVMELSPGYNPDSETTYTVVLEGAEVLVNPWIITPYTCIYSELHNS